MNIREIAGIDLNYYSLNREERNYAAIFFAALCRPGNITKFLELCECDLPEQVSDDFGIYFEYAYLRDLWYRIDDEETKKEIIRENLKIKGIDQLLSKSTAEINETFGVAGTPSDRYIQFPGKWSLKKYYRNFPDGDDLLKICSFKWSFNIKPDIVIHLDKDTAICIEAKYESGEGFYPASADEKKIFYDLGLDFVGQTELQEYMMEELLGIESEFIFLVYKKQKSDSHRVISWQQAFEVLDLTDMPNFALNMIENISEQVYYKGHPSI